MSTIHLLERAIVTLLAANAVAGCSSASGAGAADGGIDAEAGAAATGAGMFCVLPSGDGECAEVPSAAWCNTFFGGTPVTVCPTANLVGCCTLSGAQEQQAGSSEICVYTGNGASVSGGMQWCAQMNGTFSAGP